MLTPGVSRDVENADPNTEFMNLGVGEGAIALDEGRGAGSPSAEQQVGRSPDRQHAHDCKACLSFSASTPCPDVICSPDIL